MESIVKALAVLGVIVFMGLLLALPTMWLWNWLAPLIFGLTTLTFWQALGLNLLCGILFKSSASVSNKK